VFPGAASPNPNSPEVPVVAALQAALRGAGGAGRQVHLVEWVPYDLWPALAAHASAHCLVDRPGWESALASRTRFVDALAYGVRVVHTGHDPLALAMAQELGAAFRAGWNDRGSLTAALRAALEVPWDRSDPDAWQPLRHRYHWSSVATLLLDAVRQGLTRSPDRASTEEVTAWIEHYPVPEPPGKLRRLWERWRK
ncbi:MAG TPA: hypothetical protein VEI97_18290, partial [bacterium]|nr:hypothetical protein [bacterium]